MNVLFITLLFLSFKITLCRVTCCYAKYCVSQNKNRKYNFFQPFYRNSLFLTCFSTCTLCKNNYHSVSYHPFPCLIRHLLLRLQIGNVAPVSLGFSAVLLGFTLFPLFVRTICISILLLYFSQSHFFVVLLFSRYLGLGHTGMGVSTGSRAEYSADDRRIAVSMHSDDAGK